MNYEVYVLQNMYIATTSILIVFLCLRSVYVCDWVWEWNYMSGDYVLATSDGHSLPEKGKKIIIL